MGLSKRKRHALKPPFASPPLGNLNRYSVEVADMCGNQDTIDEVIRSSAAATTPAMFRDHSTTDEVTLPAAGTDLATFGNHDPMEEVIRRAAAARAKHPQTQDQRPLGSSYQAFGEGAMEEHTGEGCMDEEYAGEELDEMEGKAMRPFISARFRAASTMPKPSAWLTSRPNRIQMTRPANRLQL